MVPGSPEPAFAGQHQYAVVQPGDSFALELESGGVAGDAQREQGSAAE